MSPDELRRKNGLDRDARLVVESREDGLFLRPGSSLSRHTYSEQRRAEFLLATATGDEDDRKAVEAVRAMGLDPKDIPHGRRRVAS